MRGQTLWLSERRCVFWENEKILIISDPHFGKTGHFRKEGINVPQQSFQGDLHRLFEVIQFFRPSKLLITGDLFHSAHNKEIDHFFEWRGYASHLPVVLVKGNHDRFKDSFYESHNIEVHHDCLRLKGFNFTHEPDVCPEGLYTFSGHIHPAVRIHGAGRQSLRLPCFSFGKDTAILPAFGNFTGTAILRPSDDDVIFAITRREVIPLRPLKGEAGLKV